MFYLLDGLSRVTLQELFFGDTFEGCRRPRTVEEGFCLTRGFFRQRRTITAICNSLEPGKETVGSSNSPAPRFLRKLLLIYNFSGKVKFRLWFTLNKFKLPPQRKLLLGDEIIPVFE